MRNIITQKTLHVLDKVKEQGYIRAEGNAIHSYYKKINHSLANFLKNTPISPKDAVDCMERLVAIGRNTRAFFSLFPKTMMDLYDWASTGDLFTQRLAETKLLSFFGSTTPETVDQKNRLLGQIRKMSDCSQRKKEIGAVIRKLTDHYDQNQQFNEDPDLSVLTSLSGLLHQICTPRSSAHLNGEKAQAKTYFYNCITLIKIHAPALYEDLWQEKFAPTHRRWYNVPDIKEAVNVPFCNARRSWNRGISQMQD